MRKIKTIFERDWDKTRLVVDKYIDGFIPALLYGASATEKLDGTNVRITVRSNIVVRVEKRRNPDKIQKQKGIIEPWYIDADEYDSQDKYIFDGLKNTDFSNISDGEWSGELVGKNIQGNPLNLENNRIVFFSLGQAPVFDDVPITYNELKEWLPAQKSKYGNDCGIEGIVWHCKNGDMFKIKVKDFFGDKNR
ncbi:MAG: DUF5565 family protein [Patescibacteria group bacterium]|nr:DUF5565 family protein [Patescibacteria group bacterium]